MSSEQVKHINNTSAVHSQAPQRLRTEPVRSLSKTPDAHKHSNRHLRCIAEVKEEREDQKKWMRNLRSKYLNERNKIKPIYERTPDIIAMKDYRRQQEKGRNQSKYQAEGIYQIDSYIAAGRRGSPGRSTSRSRTGQSPTMSPKNKRRLPDTPKSSDLKTQWSNKHIGKHAIDSTPKEIKLSNDPYSRPEHRPAPLAINEQLQNLLRSASPTFIRPYHMHQPTTLTPRYQPAQYFHDPVFMGYPTLQPVPLPPAAGAGALHRRYRYLQPDVDEHIDSLSQSRHKPPTRRKYDYNPEEHLAREKPSSTSRSPLNHSTKLSRQHPSSKTPSSKPSTAHIRTMLEQNKSAILDFLADFVQQHH